jgi:hypothetical protein
MCRHILQNCYNKEIKAVYREEKTLHQVYYDSIEGKRRERRRYTKQEERLKIVAKLKPFPLRTDSSKQGLKKHGTRVKHVDKLCIELFPKILKKGPVMEEIKKEVLFFSKQGRKIFEALSSQIPIQEFLASGFVDDLQSVLELFGFEVKKPENLLPTVRMEKKPKPKRRGYGGPRFNIAKVHEAGFVSKAEMDMQEKHWSEKYEYLKDQ